MGGWYTGPHAVKNLHITLNPPKLKYSLPSVSVGGISSRAPGGYKSPGMLKSLS